MFPLESMRRDYPADLTPPEAKGLLDSGGGWIYLDVRTVAEFTDGHVPGAWNIPLAVATTAESLRGGRPGMIGNRNFLAVVKAHIAKDARVIVACKSGGRSSRAQRMMRQAGYTNAPNMVGGWVGGKDSSGASVAGWSRRGYPVERGDGGGKSYATLLSKVKP